MKIALCLKGKAGNKNKYATGEPTLDLARLGFNHFKENLLDSNDTDVFMHCWDRQFKEELVEMYSPKGYHFQDQINFNRYYGNLTLRQFSIASYWYSTKKCLELVDMYEKKHGFKYDCVVLSRYDLALQKKIDFKSEDLDMNCFYHNGPDPIHDHPNSKSICRTTCCDPNSNFFELGDMFFCSSSDNMKEFSKLYDNIRSYGLDSAHMVAARHLRKIGLFDKRRTFLTLFAHNFESWNSIEDGNAPLVRWAYDVGSRKNENT